MPERRHTAALRRCSSRNCLPLSEYNIYIRIEQELLMFNLKPWRRHIVSSFSNGFDKRAQILASSHRQNSILIPCSKANKGFRES